MANVSIDAAEYERLKAMAALAESKAQLRFKVSEKGCLSVYGLNAQFPVSLYLSQWKRLMDPATRTAMNAFIAAHSSEFAKPRGATTAPATNGNGAVKVAIGDAAELI